MNNLILLLFFVINLISFAFTQSYAADPATDYFVLQCAKRHIKETYGDHKIQVSTPAYVTDDAEEARWVIKIGFVTDTESYSGDFYVGLPPKKRQPVDMCVIREEVIRH
jgi:hypothetical protein